MEKAFSRQQPIAHRYAAAAAMHGCWLHKPEPWALAWHTPLFLEASNHTTAQ
jgi:hypothetical protein